MLKCPSRGPRPSPSQDGRDQGWRSANDVSAGRQARVRPLTDPPGGQTSGDPEQAGMPPCPSRARFLPPFVPSRPAEPSVQADLRQGGRSSTPFRPPSNRPRSLCSSQIWGGGRHPLFGVKNESYRRVHHERGRCFLGAVPFAACNRWAPSRLHPALPVLTSRL
jgi:hypothetical protein